MSLKKAKRKRMVPQDVVYDDDTSDSQSESDVDEGDLKSFRAQLDQERFSSHESGTESTADETEEKKERSLKVAHMEAKLSNLKDQLKSINKISSEGQSSEEEDEEMGEEEESDSEEEDEEEEKDEEEEEEENEEDQRLKIRSELSQMSIEELQKLKEKMGLKLYNRALGLEKAKAGNSGNSSGKRSEFKRDNKNRPREMSSKKTVKRFRDVVGLNSEQKMEKRDPRFDNLCGDFDEKVFKTSYKFVDDIKVRELQSLKQQLKTEEDPETIEKVKYLIQRMENQQREKAKLQQKKALDQEQRQRNKELVMEGKKPHFAGKRERQNVQLVQQFEELKKSGKLDNYIKKKNKKHLAKDRKRFKLGMG